MRNSVILVFCSLAWHGHAQTFDWKSNDLHINNKVISQQTSIMPTISWIQPRLEFTNTVELRVEIEATIQSEVAIINKSII